MKTVVFPSVLSGCSPASQRLRRMDTFSRFTAEPDTALDETEAAVFWGWETGGGKGFSGFLKGLKGKKVVTLQVFVGV